VAGDLYDELGVNRTATDKEIQSAYRRLAKQHHPDANQGNARAEDRFKRVSAAYKILKDKDLRARYDRGEIDENGQEIGIRFGRGGNRSGFGQGGFSQGGFEFQSGGGFGGFEDILNDLFAGRAGGARQPQPKGRDLKQALNVDFVDAARGSSRRIDLPSGRSVDINIPAGIETGKILRLKGQGEPGPAGGGDLLVEVTVLPHSNMRRDGLDILADQPIPLKTAVLGGKVRVETIDGDVSVSVPAWSDSGKTMRLRGRGIADAGSGKKGDHLVRFLTTLPENRDVRLEELMRERSPIAS